MKHIDNSLLYGMIIIGNVSYKRKEVGKMKISLKELRNLSIDEIFEKMVYTYEASPDREMDTVILLERATSYYYAIRGIEKKIAIADKNGDDTELKRLLARRDGLHDKLMGCLHELRKYRLTQKKDIKAEVVNLPDNEELMSIVEEYILNKRH